MTDHEKQFSDHWAARIWPVIKDDFERLLKTTPKRLAERAEKDKKEAKKDKSEDQQKKDKKKLTPVQEKLARTIEETNEKGERRNVYLNMAWTGPTDNTYLEEKISLAKVENLAADMFLRNVATDGSAGTANDVQGQAANDVEAAVPWRP